MQVCTGLTPLLKSKHMSSRVLRFMRTSSPLTDPTFAGTAGPSHPRAQSVSPFQVTTSPASPAGHCVLAGALLGVVGGVAVAVAVVTVVRWPEREVEVGV
jgi:hypothetical protein